MTLPALGRWLALAVLLGFSPLLLAAADDDLKEAGRLYHDGQRALALQKVDAVLETIPKNAQARFLKGVILTAQNEGAAAMHIFTGLTEDYPELPEPHNNLAVLYAAKGQYESARRELELAVRTSPDYAVAHENLGDVYAQLAADEYERTTSLDRNNNTAAPKLKLIEQLLAGKKAKTRASDELQSNPLSKP